MTDEQKQELFETIELPTLIKNEKVPVITFFNPATNQQTEVFIRGEKEVKMHIQVYYILKKHNNLDGIINFFAKQTKVENIILFDENQTMNLGLNKDKN